jgi:hypothetical protein
VELSRLGREAGTEGGKAAQIKIKLTYSSIPWQKALPGKKVNNNLLVY